MAVLLYARVSTERQAERELSIPAQLRLMKRYAHDHGWAIAGTYQDVGSGKSLRERPGLLSALREARRNRTVDGLLVHKIDRLSRNIYNYLILKGKLKSLGIRIYSVVETIGSDPMGEFLEHIMAAQAEFYSANLALEVKKGLEERLLRGKWICRPPIGYVLCAGRIVPDPARAQFIRQAFELWGTGTFTGEQLTEHLHQKGLVGPHGKRIRGTVWCRILRNPFYCGIMLIKGKAYPGTHPPLIDKTLYYRAQEIFRQKRSPGKPPRKLSFLLARKIVCPKCASLLVGEEHHKPSGRSYRYYRCHQRICRFVVKADVVETATIEVLRHMDVVGLLPELKRRLSAMPSEGLDLTQDTTLIGLLQSFEKVLLGSDLIQTRQLLDALIGDVRITGPTPEVTLKRSLKLH